VGGCEGGGVDVKGFDVGDMFSECVREVAEDLDVQFALDMQLLQTTNLQRLQSATLQSVFLKLFSPQGHSQGIN
jgi:hypothetical protein